jgi:hypothetical protein
MIGGSGREEAHRHCGGEKGVRQEEGEQRKRRCDMWLGLKKDRGHFGQLKHCSGVSIFEDGILMKPNRGMAKGRSQLLRMAHMQISLGGGRLGK